VQDHLINAEFVDTELPLESDLVGLVSGVQNSSFIGAIGVQHGEAKVAVASDRDGKLSSEHPHPPPLFPLCLCQIDDTVMLVSCTCADLFSWS
jgi:hypothetical protein